jgi:hypothetical protein
MPLRYDAGHHHNRVFEPNNAEYPACQNVGDLEQHPPSQPSTITAASLLATVQISHSIEYSSGTGSRSMRC